MNKEQYLYPLKSVIMIDEVSYTEILSIRQQVMYPDKEKEFSILDNDNKGLHIGYYLEGKLVSAVSLFLEDRELQFRKFATLTEYQNMGYGTKIMEWILDYANDMQLSKVWCNARINKTEFYKKFGFVETNQTFSKNNLEYVIMEIIGTPLV